MLSIGKLRGGGRAADYYERQVASGREDYYAEAGEARGRWVGRAAPGTGRVGEVADGELGALLDGAGLRRSPSEKAVAGFDLTFRAPKSVSVIWGVADDDTAGTIQAAHDRAVVDALGYLECEACWVRRGRDGVTTLPGDGFVGGAFRHRTSRAADPLLHTHVVIGNLAQGPDGRWTALDGRHLYRHAKAAGCLYQAALRHELTEELGYLWTDVENGAADVLGVDRRVIDHFSRRRQQIVEAMAERGVTSAQAAQVATLDTRDVKAEPKPHARLREEWRARAAEIGFDLSDVITMERRHSRTPQLDIETLTEHDSTFGRAEIIEAWASAHNDGAPVHAIEAQAERMRRDREPVAVGWRDAPAGLRELRYSTPGLLAAERQLLDAANADRVTEHATRDATGEALRRRPDLGADQRTMVERLGNSTAPIDVVRAPAGAGKTYALQAARDAWEATGITVTGCALSARAAEELHQQTGMPTATIAAVERGLDSGGGVAHGSVLVVDEAGMVGTRTLARLAAEAERVKAKLVLVGDDRQLPEIEAGGGFTAVARVVAPIELREVHRQREAWDRDALTHLRAGDVQTWADAYLDHDCVVVGADADQARDALVNDWAQAAGPDALILALRRRDVRDLNDAARARLRADGRLDGPDVAFGERTFALGDRVVTTANDRAQQTINGRRGTLVEVTEDHIDVLADHADEPQRIYAHAVPALLDHAYAMTVHRAQGATVDQAFVLADDAISREWTYTAMSRHRDTARLYTTVDALAGDRDAPVPDVAPALTRLVGRSTAKHLALDPDDLLDRGWGSQASPDWALDPGSHDTGMDMGW